MNIVVVKLKLPTDMKSCLFVYCVSCNEVKPMIYNRKDIELSIDGTKLHFFLLAIAYLSMLLGYGYNGFEKLCSYFTIV